MRQRMESGAPIPITRPRLDGREEELVLEVLRSGWLVQGKKVEQFEREFASIIGVRHAVAVSSCTTALHVALVAAGVGPGDSVILPSFTYVATANAVEYVHARPVLVDCSLETFTIDPYAVEEAIADEHRAGRRVRAIIPVSLFGHPTSMDTICSIAQRHGLIVIEDAACGLGGERAGRRVGTEAELTCFSFHPRKAITTGEGGMVVTNNDAHASEIRRLRDHGASRKGHHADQPFLLPEFNEVGFNYRMTDLQGAVGVAQLEKLPDVLAGRQIAARRYKKLLCSVPGLILPGEVPRVKHGWQAYVTLFKPDDLAERLDTLDKRAIDEAHRRRNNLMADLHASGIATRQGTHAVHTLGFYREKYGYGPMDLPAAYIADRLSLALPLFDTMTEQEQERVAETLAASILSDVTIPAQRRDLTVT